MHTYKLRAEGRATLTVRGPRLGRQHFGQTELAKRLVSILMEQPPQTFFHNHGFSLSVEGFGLPNDARFMRALLEVTSVAAAATIHQVAMHCHERGQLLAQVRGTPPVFLFSPPGHVWQQ